MSKLLSKEEFAAKISANRARIAEAQMLDSSLVDIDFGNRIDDHGMENNETLLEMDSLISELHNRRVITEENMDTDFEKESESLTSSPVPSYLKALELLENDESKLALYEQHLMEGRIQSQKLHDLVSEVAAGYKPMREVKELSALVNSEINFSSSIAEEEVDEEYPDRKESLQQMLARIGISQSEIDVLTANERKEKIIESGDAMEDELYSLQYSLQQFSSDLDHLLK